MGMIGGGGGGFLSPPGFMLRTQVYYLKSGLMRTCPPFGPTRYNLALAIYTLYNLKNQDPNSKIPSREK